MLMIVSINYKLLKFTVTLLLQLSLFINTTFIIISSYSHYKKYLILIHTWLLTLLYKIITVIYIGNICIYY